ncbi:hypothetical protein [Desulfobacter latus]|uniref:Uncharacterized protein n=1 Tax=Desulfobacter latus TaxID=2292 RepID=A0A850T9A7_9BACT|nr:hypothetical protein [Desulfobacter latus]NWH06132.1 hypothetical protein [Desulfobacter latus]
MTKVIAYEKDEIRSEKKRAPFYGAIKSENELYFQIASLYREATKGRRQLSEQMLEQMLKAKEAGRSVKSLSATHIDTRVKN